jgi:diketogulonate reductase-like aldo/keto reductase
MSVPNIPLGDGTSIPQLGFGVFEVPPEKTYAAITEALRAGYRHIDTARLYFNEEPAGQAIRDSGIPREELYVTTKLWNDDQGYDNVKPAFEGSFERLGLDYIDMYLIHWPSPTRDLYIETWEAMQELKDDDRLRSVGVSNFMPEHLDALAREDLPMPVMNQIELHPGLQQREATEYCRERDIVVEAWSPLARGEVLEDPNIAAIAGRHGKTPAQVILRWHLQDGRVVIPRSVTPSRIVENFGLFDFELDEQDMAALESLDAGKRVGPDPVLAQF